MVAGSAARSPPRPRRASCHGRVCADNVLFDDSGAAYLADFPLGTGAGLDGHGDLVGLAALAGEMIGAGRRPPAAV